MNLGSLQEPAVLTKLFITQVVQGVLVCVDAVRQMTCRSPELHRNPYYHACDQIWYLLYIHISSCICTVVLSKWWFSKMECSLSPSLPSLPFVPPSVGPQLICTSNLHLYTPLVVAAIFRGFPSILPPPLPPPPHLNPASLLLHPLHHHILIWRLWGRSLTPEGGGASPHQLRSKWIKL